MFLASLEGLNLKYLEKLQFDMTHLVFQLQSKLCLPHSVKNVTFAAAVCLQPLSTESFFVEMTESLLVASAV